MKHQQSSEEEVPRNRLLHVHSSKRMLGSCNHVVTIRINTIHDRLKIRKIRHTFVSSPIHHHRRLNKGKPTLLNEINSIGLQSHLQASKILKEIEPTSRNLSNTFQINPFVLINQLVMGLRFKIEGRLLTMQGMLRIARFISTRRNIRCKRFGIDIRTESR